MIYLLIATPTSQVGDLTKAISKLQATTSAAEPAAEGYGHNHYDFDEDEDEDDYEDGDGPHEGQTFEVDVAYASTNDDELQLSVVRDFEFPALFLNLLSTHIMLRDLFTQNFEFPALFLNLLNSSTNDDELQLSVVRDFEFPALFLNLLSTHIMLRDLFTQNFEFPALFLNLLNFIATMHIAYSSTNDDELQLSVVRDFEFPALFLNLLNSSTNDDEFQLSVVRDFEFPALFLNLFSTHIMLRDLFTQKFEFPALFLNLFC
jgi:hypothetical protein